MSLKEWKNNELNRLLLEKFGISKEELSEVEEDEEKDELDEQSKSDLEDRGARRAAGGRRLDEEQEEEELEEGKGKFDDGDGKDEKCDHVPCKDAEEETKNENLQETIQKVLKSNKKIRLRFK
jgi:hypothetical protein